MPRSIKGKNCPIRMNASILTIQGGMIVYFDKKERGHQGGDGGDQGKGGGGLWNVEEIHL